MGVYLTDEQIEKAREELSLHYALPYSGDLSGTTWEQILAEIKGGQWNGKRDNRPKPDVVVMDGYNTINYSVKTEGLVTTKERCLAKDFLGHSEDLIMARPPVDLMFGSEDNVKSFSPDELGKMVLEFYNEKIVKHYDWHVISILLRLEASVYTSNQRQFIYWESPPVCYNPDDFWWKDSDKAKGTNRNILGYPKTVDFNSPTLPRAKFKWTSGGKQFYVLYDIPHEADTWAIEPVSLTAAEIKDGIKSLLQKK